jgi:hypothetical protein
MMPPLFQKAAQVLWDSDVVEIVGFGEVIVVFVHEACFWTQEEGDGDEEVEAHFDLEWATKKCQFYTAE